MFNYSKSQPQPSLHLITHTSVSIIITGQWNRTAGSNASDLETTRPPTLPGHLVHGCRGQTLWFEFITTNLPWPSFTAQHGHRLQLTAVAAGQRAPCDECDHSNRHQRLPALQGTYAPSPDYHTTVTHSTTASPFTQARQLANKSVSWIRVRDDHILTVDRLTFVADDRYQAFYAESTGMWTLQIKYVQARDAGLYECQVGAEPKVSARAHLHVVGESEGKEWRYPRKWVFKEAIGKNGGLLMGWWCITYHVPRCSAPDGINRGAE